METIGQNGDNSTSWMGRTETGCMVKYTSDYQN